MLARQGSEVEATLKVYFFLPIMQDLMTVDSFDGESGHSEAICFDRENSKRSGQEFFGEKKTLWDGENLRITNLEEAINSLREPIVMDLPMRIIPWKMLDSKNSNPVKLILTGFF